MELPSRAGIRKEEDVMEIMPDFGYWSGVQG